MHEAEGGGQMAMDHRVGLSVVAGHTDGAEREAPASRTDAKVCMKRGKAAFAFALRELPGTDTQS